MLAYLRISQFALIDDLEMHFGPGLTVLTGETGAGKSMILQAVSLLRGERASSDWIRQGADEARIEAIFALQPGSEPQQRLHSKLEQAGIDAGDWQTEGLVVARVLGSKGRNRAYLAGQLVPLAVMAQVCGELIDISSQHEHQTLLQPSKHLRFLDRCGVSDSVRLAMKSAFLDFSAQHRLWQSLCLGEKQRAEREDFVRFQLQELQNAGLRLGEEEILREERDRLRFSEKLRDLVSRAEQTLHDRDPGLLSGVGALARMLDEGTALDAGLQPILQLARDAEIALDEVSRSLHRYQTQLHASPHRLQELEDRLYALSRILRKHGPDVSTALKKQQALEEELTQLGSQDQLREQAVLALDLLREKAAEQAEILSQERRQLAKQLEKQATAAIRSLAMPHAHFQVVFGSVVARKDGADTEFYVRDQAGNERHLSVDGWDDCQFLFSPNPGEPPKPLQQVASGGELSRILLALKQIVGRADDVATYVFDEVDAGIGGAVADTVGKNLQGLSRTRQVLCITHLGQIAAYADAHYKVEKNVNQNTTSTTISFLKKKSRIQEIARMIGGAKPTQRTEQHASELFDLAQQAKEASRDGLS